MTKSNKELAVELVIAQIQASSAIKLDQIHTGTVIKYSDVCELLKKYHNTLNLLDNAE